MLPSANKMALAKVKGSMRTLALACLASLPLAVLAQAERSMIASAVTDLGAANIATVQYSGTEQYGYGNRDIWVSLALQKATFSSAPSISTYQVEQIVRVDGNIIHRAVADGRMVWAYDVRRNTFSSTRYQIDSSGGFSDFGARMFRALKVQSPREAAFANHLFQAAFSGSFNAATWSPYLSTGALAASGDDVDNTADHPRTATVRYDMTNTGLGYRFDGASFNGFINGGQANWTGTVWQGTLPPGTSFQFVPPTGARPVAAGLNQGGG